MVDVSGIPNMGFGGGGYFGGSAALGQPAMSAAQINAGMWGNYSPGAAQAVQNNIYGAGGFGAQPAYYAGLGAAYGRQTGGFGGYGAANADPFNPYVTQLQQQGGDPGVWGGGAPAFNPYGGGANPGGFSPSPNYTGSTVAARAPASDPYAFLRSAPSAGLVGPYSSAFGYNPASMSGGGGVFGSQESANAAAGRPSTGLPGNMSPSNYFDTLTMGAGYNPYTGPSAGYNPYDSASFGLGQRWQAPAQPNMQSLLGYTPYPAGGYGLGGGGFSSGGRYGNQAEADATAGLRAGDIGYSRQPSYPNIGYNPGMENLFANPAMGGGAFQGRFGMGFPNAGTPSQYYTGSAALPGMMPPGFAGLYGADNPGGALPAQGFRLDQQ